MVITSSSVGPRTIFDQHEDIDLDSVAYGFMASKALFTALELGIFDIIDQHSKSGSTASEIGEACGVLAPRLQTLLTALCAIKCIYRSQNGMYTLSPNTATYMVKRSKAYYGDYLRLQINNQFYQYMASLPSIMKSGEAPDYASLFSHQEVADMYTKAQHNGSIATAKQLFKKLNIKSPIKMLDVGGGSGAFSYVAASLNEASTATVLEFPEVCRTGESILAEQPSNVRSRIKFVELDATNPQWPVNNGEYDFVLMSYISGSVPEGAIKPLYEKAYKALKSSGFLVVHDFMVDDDLQGPALGALWGLQHVAVNAEGLGLCPQEIIKRMVLAGFNASDCKSDEMIHGMTKIVVAKKP